MVDEKKESNKDEIKREVFDNIFSGRKKAKIILLYLIKRKYEKEELLKSIQKYIKTIPNSKELIIK